MPPDNVPDYSITFVFSFICRFRIEALQQHSNVFVELVPVTIDNIQNSIVLCLPFLQLFNALPQFRLASDPLLNSLNTMKDPSGS